MYDVSTRLARSGSLPDDPHRATAPPLYQTATFGQCDPHGFGEFDYTRTDNPTRRAVEASLADLEGAAGALCFASGMAAIAATLRSAPAGSTILCGRDLYGGTQRFLHDHLTGMHVRHVDFEGGEFESALECGDVSIVFVETPTNPRLEIVDLRAIARRARAAGALFVVDGTAMTPYLQKPLECGADVVVHSATKGLAGHGDVTAGVVAARDASLLQAIAARRNAEGSGLAPFEAWLLGRGLKTLGVRVDTAQRTARAVALRLRELPWVDRVHYPGLSSTASDVLHASQARGGGVLVSVECDSEETARRVASDTELFSIAVSFGGVSSSISIPCKMSHASVPEGAAPIPSPRLLRLSIGLESSADLLTDLERAGAAGPSRVRETASKASAARMCTDRLPSHTPT